MGLVAADYLAQLQALLPVGPAWPQEAGAVLTKMLDAWAQEFARTDARMLALIEESDPRTTNERLADWERVAGLPDACVLAIDGGQTTAQRIDALVGKLKSTGGQSPAYFVALAAYYGYVITITEYRAHTVDDDVNYPVYGEVWNFSWAVHAPSVTQHEFDVNDTVNQPLAVWGNTQLECIINRVKPAHSQVVYIYS